MIDYKQKDANNLVGPLFNGKYNSAKFYLEGQPDDVKAENDARWWD